MKPRCIPITAALVLALAACANQRTWADERPNPKASPVAGATGARHVEPLFVHVTAAAFSPDNKYMLTGYKAGGKLLTLWEVASGKEVRSFPGQTSVTGVAFLDGGRRALAADFSGRLVLHDVATGKTLHSVQAYPEFFPCLAASPDGKLAVTSGNEKRAAGVLKVWDADLRLLRTFGGKPQPGPEARTSDQGFTSPSPRLADLGENGPGFAISADGCWALSCPPVRLWDLKAGKLAQALQERAWGGQVAAFSPNSRLALVARWRIVEKDQAALQFGVWTVGSGKAPRLLEGQGGPVGAFTETGKQVAGPVLSGDNSLGEDFHVKGDLKISFWDVATGKVARYVILRPPKANHQRLFFSRGPRLALIAAGGVYEGSWGKRLPRQSELTLAVWDLNNGRLVRQWTRPPASK